MNTQNHSIIQRFIRDYFKRVSILITQIPFEIRGLLLPSYMLYNGFKGIIHFDPTGRKAFEIYRQASRISIKLRKANERVEKEIFGVLGSEENMFKLQGHDSEISGLNLTCKAFKEHYEQQIPKNVSTFNFNKTGSIGPFEITEDTEVKITDVHIYWMIGRRRFVKFISFAWAFGSNIQFEKIDPVLHADSHFYSSLFGNLYQIITKGYKEKVDKTTRLKVFKTFEQLVGRIYTEVKNELAITKTDEQEFQRLIIRYKFFLSPGALSIKGQPILSGRELRKPVFRIETRSGKIIYIEIEPPFCKPFEGVKVSRRLKGALKQVSDWKDILSQKVSKKEGISYLIIIGLLDDLDEVEKRRLKEINQTQKDLSVVTWDWVLDRINEERNMIRRQIQEL
jgi:hypothetical protein